VAASANWELAQAFLAFMISEPFQSTIAEGNWMYPARVPDGGLPASFANLGEPPHSFLTPPDVVRDKRRVWIDEWLDAMSR
jgi:thiamine transport system substrate-binding protein